MSNEKQGWNDRMKKLKRRIKQRRTTYNDEKEVDNLIQELLNGLKTELIANGCTNEHTEASKGYNQGIKNAVDFINRYKQGSGLFQQ